MKKILAIILMIMLSFSAMAADVPQAVSRGGTVVIQIPWEWINSAEMGGTWWGGIYQGEDERLTDVLFNMLPPSEVASAVLGGYSGARMIRTFGFNGWDSKALRMSSRPLEDAWYCVVRPEYGFSNNIVMYSTVMEYSLIVQDGVASGNLEREKVDQNPINIPVTAMDDLKASWKKDYSGFSLSLFPVQQVYIAVIYEKNAPADDLSNTRLLIPMTGYDYEEVCIDLDGYMDGKTGVYCCVLSGEEALQITEGAAVRLGR